jgi:hypothetical protein
MVLIVIKFWVAKDFNIKKKTVLCAINILAETKLTSKIIYSYMLEH